MHLCSNFAVRRQMAPVQSIKFQTANFSIFCARIIVIFCTTCIGRQDFLCCDNGRCDAYPAGIALPQKRHCFCFYVCCSRPHCCLRGNCSVLVVLFSVPIVVSEMTYYVSSGTLNSTNSTQLCTYCQRL